MARYVPYCSNAPDYGRPVLVPELSHEEAVAMVRVCYLHWMGTARKKGWSDKFGTMAIQVWLGSEGEARDSIYIPGNEALIVIDTTHLHAGEICDGEFEEVVARVPMDDVRASLIDGQG